MWEAEAAPWLLAFRPIPIDQSTSHPINLFAMNERYDAVIIGGGHNGLVAGALLAKAGKRVLILEKRQTLGGSAATEEIFPGFKFNTGGEDAGLFRPELVKELALERHGLTWLEGPAVAFAPREDGPGLTLWRDPTRTQAELAEGISAKEAASYHRFTQLVARMAQVLDRAMLQTPPNPKEFDPRELLPWAMTGLKLRQLGKRDMMEFLRILPMSVREFLDEWFEDPFLKGLLATQGVAGTMQGPYAAGTAYLFLYHHLGGGQGVRASRFVKGGVGQLSVALASAAALHGATVRLGAGVARIRTSYGQVTGVLLEDGQEIPARAVLSSADPRRTLFDLLGPQELEPRVMRRVRNIRFRGSTAKVNLALRGLPRFHGQESQEQLTGHVVISPSMAYLERAYDDAKYGRPSQEPALDVVIPTLLDPSLAPEGHHILSVTVQYAPYALAEGTWDEQREALGDRVVALLARYAPDLPDRVLHRQVLTPLDLEREYGLTEGSIYHGQMDLDQQLFMRPIPGYGQYAMPVGNLYLCGAGAHPGGGITGAPGLNAAREVLRALG